MKEKKPIQSLLIKFYTVKDRILHVGKRWDAQSVTKDTAIDFAHKYINDEPSVMQNEYNYNLHYHLSHFGECVNKNICSGYPDATDNCIIHMVAKNTTSVNLILYRGMDPSLFNLMRKDAQIRSDCDLYEKGFLFCSLVKGAESRWQKRLRIFVPAGSKCVYQGDVNNEQAYYEVVVMTGARLKIISIDSEYTNCMLMSTN